MLMFRIDRRISKKGDIIWRELKSSNGTDVTAGSDDNEEISQQDFKASNGWVVHFINRHGLTLRKRTSLAQHDPDNLIDRVISFILNVRRKFHTKQYAMANVIAMDETPIWLDMPSATTVNEAGASSVTIRSTGHEKDRVTVCLAAKANGHKLKPFIVFKGGKRDVKRMNEDRQLSGKCVIRTSANGWMNESLTEEWIQYVVGRLSFAPRLLVWDTYKCHMTNGVKEALRQTSVDAALVHGGCTKYTQAPDVSWNKPFKNLCQIAYDDWMAETEHEITPAGRIKAPSRRSCVERILAAWERLPSDIIKKSFEVCAISLPINGSEDEKIHCFQKKGPLSNGREEFTERAAAFYAALGQGAPVDENDPFADLEPDIFEERNEIVVHED